ncbi:MAG: hypothetical protein ACRDIB_20690 [Ardenticatenaceae bacterium]
MSYLVRGGGVTVSRVRGGVGQWIARVLLLAVLGILLREAAVEAELPAATVERAPAGTETGIPAHRPPRAPLSERAAEIYLMNGAMTPAIELSLPPAARYAVATDRSIPLYRAPIVESAYDILIPTGSYLDARAILASGEWLQVEWEGHIGWVELSALVPLPDSSRPRAQP